MIDATRRWLRRNRTTFAIGAGVVGAGYIAGQYVVSKIGEARERMVSERVGKEKCEQLRLSSGLADSVVAYDDDSSKIKRTALLRSLNSYQPSPKMSLQPNLLKRSPKNCR